MIRKRILEANATYSLINDNDRLLVAVSGGADSVALLCLLKEIFPKATLFACHVNHMLRNDEADRDMFFVKNLCEKLDVNLDILKTNVAEYANKNNLGTELAARILRYDYFKELCVKHGINKIATAHTLSDSAETFLFNLSRGAGLQGLSGIPAIRPLTDSINVIRPLIYVKRSEIEEYLAETGMDYVTDSTNLSDDYTRNYIRHNIIPLFKNINPSFEDSIRKATESIISTQSFINNHASNYMTDDIFTLCSLEDCILSCLLRKQYEIASGNTLIENVHIKKAIELLRKSVKSNGQKEYYQSIPGKITFIIKNGKASFVNSRDLSCSQSNSGDFSLTLSFGLNQIEKTPFAVFISDDICEFSDNYTLFDSIVIDKSKINGNLYVRSRHDGDTIKTCNMTKKVKSLLNHSKIPKELRSVLPFLCDDTGILFIPSVAKKDGVNVNTENKADKIYISILKKSIAIESEQENQI